MLGPIGIVLSLMLLMTLAYRNHSVIVMAPLCALLAVVIEGKLPVLAAYTQIFGEALGTFIVRYFPLFLLGAIFGKWMEESRSAESIARGMVRWCGPKHAVLAVVLTCSVLTYGGVSLFVVVFTTFPLAQSLFRQADVPARLIPASIALGAFTYTMTALPGSVQIQNLIPMPFFKTTSFAAPGFGILAAMIMFAFGIAWLGFQHSQARKQSEGFYLTAPINPSDRLAPADAQKTMTLDTPSLSRAMTPLVVLIALNYFCSQHWIPTWQADYLSQERFGATQLNKVQGTWSAIVAMAGALLCMGAIHRQTWTRVPKILADGASGSLLPVFNAASEFGYGSTVAALAGFGAVKSWMVSIAPSQPLVSEALSINVLAGITGSASGGLSIAMEALGGTFLENGLRAGVSPELMHRVASLSCGGLDTLPHNAAVVTLLLICGCTHRQSYRDILMVSLVGPLFATGCVLAVAAWMA